MPEYIQVANRITVADFRARLAGTVRDVRAGREPVIITNFGQDAAVLISVEDFDRFIGGVVFNQSETRSCRRA